MPLRHNMMRCSLAILSLLLPAITAFHQAVRCCPLRSPSTALNGFDLPNFDFFNQGPSASRPLSSDEDAEEDPHQNHGSPPLITSIDGIDEYLDFIGQPHDQRLTVVKVSQHTCVSCVLVADLCTCMIFSSTNNNDTPLTQTCVFFVLAVLRKLV